MPETPIGKNGNFQFWENEIRFPGLGTEHPKYREIFEEVTSREKDPECASALQKK